MPPPASFAGMALLSHSISLQKPAIERARNARRHYSNCSGPPCGIGVGTRFATAGMDRKDGLEVIIGEPLKILPRHRRPNFTTRAHMPAGFHGLQEYLLSPDPQAGVLVGREIGGVGDTPWS